MSFFKTIFGLHWDGHGDNVPYAFKDTRQPSPGTQEYAFQPLFFLPPNALLGYGGVNVRHNLHELQQPQVMHNLAVSNATAGGPGVVAGTVYGQPLLAQDATGTNSSNATG